MRERRKAPKKSGRLAGLERPELACRAGTQRRHVEDEDGGSDEFDDELHHDRGADAAADDQLQHGARAQRSSSWFTDSF